MNILHAIILGIVQGLTEFIPVSSSAHLVLVPWVFGWPAPGLLFDTMLHWGTLTAVVAYFWRDWISIIRGFFRSLTAHGPWNSSTHGRLADADSRLAWGIIIGSLPAVVFGVLFEAFFESLFGSPAAVAVFLLVTAGILTLSERLGSRTRSLKTLTMTDAVAVGFAQAVAIAPGISRSGATIAAGLARGLKREDAARYSFLLSTPIIFGAGLKQLLDVVTSGASAAAPWGAVLAGTLAAALSGYLCIRFLLAYLRSGKLYVFAAYLVMVSVAILILNAIR